MPRAIAALFLCAALLFQGIGLPANAGKKMTTKEALKPLNDLIGQWKGTGVPKGSKQDIQKGFWVETLGWAWKFKGDDAWLGVSFEKGKYFTKGELRYLPEQGVYQLTLQTIDKKSVVFTGSYEDRWLTLQRVDPQSKQNQKLVFRLLHSNRFLYQYDVQPEGKSFFSHVYQVGATKLGVDFASGDGRPECIVSGGLGTIAVSYQGKTYYVCCSGCRDEFLSAPQKYIDAAKNKKK